MSLDPAFVAHVLDPLLAAWSPASLLLDQIGADDALALHLATAAPGAALHIADRDPRFDARTLAGRLANRTVLHASFAANVLELIAPPDLLILAGDPNWYTVHSALTTAARRASRFAARFPVVLVARAGWPYGRRDGYADPAAIPEPYRAPHERAGVRPGQASLAAGGGLYPDRIHAREEHAPKLGVLTAIEDFLDAHAGGADARPRLQVLPMLEGLALLLPSPLPPALDGWADSLRLGSAARELTSIADLARANREAELAELHRAVAGERARADALRAALLRKRDLSLGPEPGAAPGLWRRALRRVRRNAERSGPPEADLSRLRQSPVFDAEWYGERYADVAASGVDAVVHFLEHGAAEGRDPGPFFSTSWYLTTYPDVAAAGLNPLLHYLRSGAAEGRDPGPTFSTRGYLASQTEIDAARINPLEHWIRAQRGA